MKKAANALPNRHLKRERELRCWSQLNVADAVGTTAFNVSRWERGITVPNAHFCQKLCHLFEKGPQELGLREARGSAKKPPQHIVFSGSQLGGGTVLLDAKGDSQNTASAGFMQMQQVNGVKVEQPAQLELQILLVPSSRLLVYDPLHTLKISIAIEK